MAEPTAAAEEKDPRLLDMINWVESEAERLEIWAKFVTDPDARKYVLANARVARMAVKTLDLLYLHEALFVRAIRTAREVDARRQKSASR